METQTITISLLFLQLWLIITINCAVERKDPGRYLLTIRKDGVVSGFGVQVGFTKCIHVFSSLSLHQHSLFTAIYVMEFQLKNQKELNLDLTLMKSATLWGKFVSMASFMGTHYYQCSSAESNFVSAAAAVVVITFAPLQCLPGSFSLGIVHLWEFTVGRCRSCADLLGGWLIKGWVSPCTVPRQ